MMVCDEVLKTEGSVGSVVPIENKRNNMSNSNTRKLSENQNVVFKYKDNNNLITNTDFEKLKIMDVDNDGTLSSLDNEIDAIAAKQLEILVAGRRGAQSQTILYDVIAPNGNIYADGIISILGGECEMGSTIDGKTELYNTRISSFKISASEVTIGQYKNYLVAIGDSTFSQLPEKERSSGRDKYPITSLSYEDMQAFCRFYGGELPTAAQIIYASRGPNHNLLHGTTTDKMGIIRNLAYHPMPAIVCGQFNERNNGWGCDYAGNLLEATSDQHDINFYLQLAEQSKNDPNFIVEDPKNPITDPTTQMGEARGGSWDPLVFMPDPTFGPPEDSSFEDTTVFASRPYPLSGSFDVGFRVVWPS